MDESGEAEELQDFLVNFKFSWEQESAVHKPVHTVSRRHTLSDTTPARRAKRISGKVLLDEFCGLTNSDQTDANSNAKLKDQVPPQGDTFKAELLQEADNATKSNELAPLHSLSSRKQKRRKRQSGIIKKRESIALLKTIGEISSPDISGQIQQNSSFENPAFWDCPSSSNFSKVKPVTKTKDRTSRRRSSRLSGMMAPLLELGDNGIPKLVHLEEEDHGVNNIEESKTSDTLPHHIPLGPDSGLELATVAKDVFETLSPQPFTSSMGTSKAAESDLTSTGYRVKYESPITPLVGITDGVVEAGQYTTPQAFSFPSSSSTPDKRMINSFDSLQLQRSFCTPLQEKADNITEFSKKELQILTPEYPMDEGTSITESTFPKSPQHNDSSEEAPMLQTPKTFSREFFEEACETDSTSEMDVDKENIQNYSLSEEEQNDKVEIDDKVKEFYLKRGQTATKKKRNTNLETVFEELRPEDAGIGKRKFRRSLAFPAKPWEARRGTKARKKTKKKRMSLSKVAKKQDSSLQERLTNILQGLAEEL